MPRWHEGYYRAILVPLCRRAQFPYTWKVADVARRTAARTLRKISLRTASGPEGSSDKQSRLCRRPSGSRFGARHFGTSALLHFGTSALFPVAYQVIARKWRPQRFDDVIGQQAVTQTLRNALARGGWTMLICFPARAAWARRPPRASWRGVELHQGPDARSRAAVRCLRGDCRGPLIDVLEIDAAVTPGSTMCARPSSATSPSLRPATATWSSSSTKSISCRTMRSTPCLRRWRSRRHLSSS